MSSSFAANCLSFSATIDHMNRWFRTTCCTSIPPNTAIAPTTVPIATVFPSVADAVSIPIPLADATTPATMTATEAFTAAK